MQTYSACSLAWGGVSSAAASLGNPTKLARSRHKEDPHSLARRASTKAKPFREQALSSSSRKLLQFGAKAKSLMDKAVAQAKLLEFRSSLVTLKRIEVSLSKEVCPYCQANLQGDPVPEDDRECSAVFATHFSPLISVSDPDHDEVVPWRCPGLRVREAPHRQAFEVR